MESIGPGFFRGSLVEFWKTPQKKTAGIASPIVGFTDQYV